MENTVSVIIPTHNRASLIVTAVHSVLKQTHQALEVIVVDDASTDDTQTQLQTLANNDKRVRFIRNEVSLGGAKSRNKGIALSQSRWIAFLDDDDTWLPEKLELQLKTLSYHPNALACSAGYQVHYPLGFKKTVLPASQISLDTLLQSNSLGGCSVCLCDATQLKQLGGFDEKLRSAQDWDLWVRLRMLGDIIAIAKPLVIYQVHFDYRISNNMSAKYRGSRVFYFKHRAMMSEKAQRMNLSFISFICSRQTERSFKSRFKHLRIAIRHSEAKLGFAYLLSSLPRLLLAPMIK